MVVFPPPSNVIPLVLGIVTRGFQVQEPPGTTTASPLLAELMADCTSVDEQEIALMFAATPGQGKKTHIKKM